MGPPCLLRISRVFPPRKGAMFWPFNKSFIDRACAVKMAVYWPLSITHIVNPLVSPTGGLFISNPFEGGLNRDGGLILEKTMVSVIHKELEYKVEKLKYKKIGVHAAEDQEQIRTSSW